MVKVAGTSPLVQQILPIFRIGRVPSDMRNRMGYETCGSFVPPLPPPPRTTDRGPRTTIFWCAAPRFTCTAGHGDHDTPLLLWQKGGQTSFAQGAIVIVQRRAGSTLSGTKAPCTVWLSFPALAPVKRTAPELDRSLPAAGLLGTRSQHRTELQRGKCCQGFSRLVASI